MKFLKKKKYSILLNIFRYSFVGIFAITLIFPIIFVPDNAIASNPEFRGLVPVCNTEVDSENGGFKDPCDFNMVMALINKVINFLLITLATPLFALITIYVGWLYLSDMGSSENITKAKKIFKNVFIGYIIALAAWLIVKTILVSVGFDPTQAFLEI